MKKVYGALLWCLVALPLWVVAVDTAIRQQMISIKHDTATIVADLNATVTTENSIYADAFATMTTAHDIKLDTQASVTMSRAILVDALATLTTATAINVDLYSTMTTANSIKLDTAATVTTDKLILTDLIATVTTSALLVADMFATNTTVNAIKADTAVIIQTLNAANSVYHDTHATLTMDVADYNNLADIKIALLETPTILLSIQETAQEIIVDSAKTVTTARQIPLEALAVVAGAPALAAEVHATMTSANNIKIDTDALALQTPTVLANLSAAQAVLDNIKIDSSAMQSSANTINSNVVATTNSSNYIKNQTVILTIPIAGGTISTPGTYKLTNNISGTIIIDSDNVTLSLNGYSVTNDLGDAIIINDGHKNINILNGNLTGSFVPTSYVGIKVGNSAGGCSNIVIEHIRITGFNYGVRVLDNALGILLRKLNISVCNYGIYATLVSFLRIRQSNLELDPSAASVPSPIGVYATAPSAAEVGGTIIYDTVIKGFANSIDIENSSDAIIFHCTLGVGATGIRLYNCSTSVVVGCNISRFTGFIGHGIDVEGCTATIIKNCIINYVFGDQTTGSAMGIEINNSNYCAVSNCLIFYMNGASAFGILVAGTSAQSIIRDNTVTYCYDWGAVGTGVISLTASGSNNVFTRNRVDEASVYNAPGFSATISPVSTSISETNVMYNLAIP